MKNTFWCDFYHLTTAQTLFNEGMHETQDTFEAFIRKNPFGGGYTVSAGLALVLEWIKDWGYSKSGIKKLATLKYPDGTRKFSDEFLNYIQTQPCKLTINAMPEGELVFPNEPIYQISGPKWQVLMVETAVLNAMNSSSLIATKASRVKYAANGKTVIEFGLRRMQEINGLNVTRSVMIGGVDATSNVDAGLKYDLPLVGTHPHAFVMSFDNEYDAFYAWLKNNPQNRTLLLDTYNTERGIDNAIRAAKALGFEYTSGRLDSGDLNYLSNSAHKKFDAENVPQGKIIASNDLNEYTIQSLESQGAHIDIYGVGTAMVTASDQPALGGVYKIKETDGKDKIKFSEDAIKTTIPGATEVIRMLDSDGKFSGDVILSSKNSFVQSGYLPTSITSVNIANGKHKVFNVGHQFYKPMVRVVTDGAVDKKFIKKPVMQIAEFAKRNLDKLDKSHRRFENPHQYVSGLELALFQKRQQMIEDNQR